MYGWPACGGSGGGTDATADGPNRCGAPIGGAIGDGAIGTAFGGGAGRGGL